MAKLRVYNFQGMNVKQTPLLHSEGELLWCKNLVTDIRGAKTKRTGYELVGGTFSGNVTSLYSWVKPGGLGTKYYYAYSDQVLYYTNQLSGSTTWSQVSYGTNNGTIGIAEPKWASMGSFAFMAGASNLLNTSTGTSFGTMALAPTLPIDLVPYKQRLFVAAGTILYASELGSPTGWSTGTTNPSFSEPMDGRGQIVGLHLNNDEIIVHQAYGEITHYDGYRKYQSPSTEGAGYKYSISNTSGVTFYSNNESLYGFTTQPQKLGLAIEPLYRLCSAGTSSTAFYTNYDAYGVAFDEKFYLYAGNMSLASFAKVPIYGREENYVTWVYDLNNNEWSFWQTHDAMYSIYYDGGIYANGLLFGSDNEIYKFSDSVYSDNGQAINAEMVGVLHMKEPERDKIIKRVTAHASPGCGATFSIAVSDELIYDNLQWRDIGDLYGGIRKWIAPMDLRGKYVFYRLYESSTNKPFTFYGFTIDFDYVGE